MTNLVEGERYVFAVAAYDKNGDLIGGGISPTSHACPASHPMPMIMAWAYLTQVNDGFCFKKHLERTLFKKRENLTSTLQYLHEFCEHLVRTEFPSDNVFL